MTTGRALAAAALLAALLLGCGEGPDAARVEAELAAGNRVDICDARLKITESQVIVERTVSPEPIALMIIAVAPVVVLLVLLALRKVRTARTLIAMGVLLVVAVLLSAFVGTERFVFDPGARELKRVEGWFLNLHRIEHATAYHDGMEVYVAEEETDDTLWIRLWVRTAPDRSMRMVECRGTHSTTDGLRRTLPSLARTIETRAGLR